MKRFVESHKGSVLAAILGAAILMVTTTGVSTQTPAAASPGTPRFLQPGHCYRFTFSIEGTPEWKVTRGAGCRIDQGEKSTSDPRPLGANPPGSTPLSSSPREKCGAPISIWLPRGNRIR